MDNYLQLALIALIFGIIGYLIGKITSRSSGGINDEKWKLEIANQQQQNISLQTELNQLKNTPNRFISQTNDNKSTKPAEFNATEAKSVFGKSIKENDLKIVEGIGPKIEELFNTSGILTWKALSESSIDRLREILSKAGERYHIHDPSTWPKQAKFAYEGKWKELKDLQNSLDGGREV